MIVWVPGEMFNKNMTNVQRARIIAVCPDSETLVVRSCSDSTKLAEIDPGDIVGAELTSGGPDECTIRFTVAGTGCFNAR
jgi:hypothetical protein